MNFLKYVANIAKYLPYLSLIDDIDSAVKAAKAGKNFTVSAPVKAGGKVLMIVVSGTEIL